MAGKSIFDSLDHSQGRPTLINWENQLARIISDYEDNTTVVHGVQKDAVQNSWDARNDKKAGKGWGMEFELLDKGNGDLIVSMRDFGTSGLTGRILSREEYQLDLPIAERWGRFENLAFTKDPTEEALGARGQGKFIFLAASKSHRIVYDTLREDGVYRLGIRLIAGVTDCLSFSWEGEEAIEKLNEYAPALAPLSDIGTRVIIEDPIDDLIEAFRSGKIDRMISETWWEIILKHDASIEIASDGKKREIDIPEEIHLLVEKSDKVKIHSVSSTKLPVKGKSLRVKRLSVAYAPDIELPDDIRGIAVQRGGMKITSWTPRFGPPEAAGSIYGWIAFDKKLDREMALWESSTHYDFNWKRQVPLNVKRFMEKHLGDFYQKLGFISDPIERENRKRQESERKALLIANKVAKSLGIGRSVGGKGNGGGAGGGRRKSKPVGISMPELELPQESFRVEYDESVKNIAARIWNSLDTDVQVHIKVFMTFGLSEVVSMLHDEEATIKAQGSLYLGPYEIEMDESQYPAPGKYVLRAKLINMMDDPPKKMKVDRKGREIDKDAKAFYLAQDPPTGGLWEDVRPITTWIDPPKSMQLGEYMRGEAGGYVYSYNVKHLAHESLNGDEDARSEFIFRLLVQGAIEIDLESEPPSLFADVDTGDPNQVARRIGIITGEALSEFYS